MNEFSSGFNKSSTRGMSTSLSKLISSKTEEKAQNRQDFSNPFLKIHLCNIEKSKYTEKSIMHGTSRLVIQVHVKHMYIFVGHIVFSILGGCGFSFRQPSLNQSNIHPPGFFSHSLAIH